MLHCVDTPVFPWTVCPSITTKTSSVFSFEPHPPHKDFVLTEQTRAEVNRLHFLMVFSNVDVYTAHRQI